ncbi:MAG: deoxyribonuclease IV [Planctomycetes bacterium]|nr:deoxyribonuclease IV [Planctomycetota bacterium]MCH9726551.1 deoxyribonuclease IV [Planctomycetota bacterium]MCH9779220.1 deoxyribonuclease IV [Planctomycetota bacterium]MCH9790166.1 deoxyribonuclease IV [Planctomycetota bacterium]
MPILGAHQSIAGGYYKAVNTAAQFEMDCVQIFTKNNNQWRAKPLTDKDVSLFKERLAETGVGHPCSHMSYLINLASPKDELWDKSIASVVIELERAEALGLEGAVMHPGSFVTSSEQEGLDRIVAAIDLIHQQTEDFATQIWLETTAGQGSNLGFRFEQLAYLLEQVKEGQRLGICVDTCHIFAAGYPLIKKSEYASTMAELDNVIGFENVRAFHINDSKCEFGSRKDRHENIGRGCLGLEPFRHLLNDSTFQDRPMYLETPKDEEDGVPLDQINMETLRKLYQG